MRISIRGVILRGPVAFPKGKSGNPSGQTAPQAHARKRSSRRIAELTGDGDEIIKRLLLLSRGVTSPEELEKLGGAQAFADGKIAAATIDRIRLAQAATLDLRDMLQGKPTSHVEIEDVTPATDGLDEVLSALSPEELTRLASLGLIDDAPAPASPPTPAPDAAIH